MHMPSLALLFYANQVLQMLHDCVWTCLVLNLVQVSGWYYYVESSIKQVLIFEQSCSAVLILRRFYAQAIERRRARREEGEGLETESPLLQDQIVHDPSVSTSVAQLEQDPSVTSPLSKAGIRCCPPTVGKVPKILLDVTNQSEGGSTSLTPQKKLLNNIEVVERVVMEELHKLKSTPSAKKAERQKRVRSLMSMRWGLTAYHELHHFPQSRLRSKDLGSQRTLNIWLVSTVDHLLMIGFLVSRSSLDQTIHFREHL